MIGDGVFVVDDVIVLDVMHLSAVILCPFTNFPIDCVSVLWLGDAATVCCLFVVVVVQVPIIVMIVVTVSLPVVVSDRINVVVVVVVVVCLFFVAIILKPSSTLCALSYL